MHISTGYDTGYVVLEYNTSTREGERKRGRQRTSFGFLNESESEHDQGGRGEARGEARRA